MPLSVLYVSHSLLYSLQHLSLHNQDLLKRWRWVGSIVVIVFICGMAVSVGRLMTVKRFETEIEIEIKIEIKYSLLYASRYNDD
jgi:hypothetical protein